MTNAEVEHISSYHLGTDESGNLIDTFGKRFDVDAYSRMKWGLKKDTKQFATVIADSIVEELPEIISSDRPPGFIQIYENIPHAATILTEYTLEEINYRRNEDKQQPGEVIRLYASDYFDDYSKSSFTERQRILEIQRRGMYLMSNNLNYLNPIVLDDIFVTGKTMQTVVDALDMYTDQPIITSSIAIFDQNLAAQCPNLEGELDSCSIKNVEELFPFIERDEVEVSFRLLKELISMDTKDFENYVDSLPEDFLKEVLVALDSMNYKSTVKQNIKIK